MSNPFWSERYRPSLLKDVILPPRILADFQSMVDKGEVPNLLLSGPPGIGKTTTARAMLSELGHDVYVVNGSLKGNIDTLRNEIMDFASSMSFSDSRKTVLIDEADYLNAQSTQPALRNFMEEFSGNCGFILTCNYRGRIIPALQSRCRVIDFTFSREDTVAMAAAFFKRITWVLDQEGVRYDKQAVGEVIKRHFPDWRRVLNELQGYAAAGQIDSGILARTRDTDFTGLIRALKDKDFGQIRKWVGENSGSDTQSFFRAFYDQALDLLEPASVPDMILAIGEYQYKAAHVADQEINMAAFLTYVMATVRFK